MRYFYTLLGFFSFLLGAVGVFLPVLPTTPFLLLSSYCFARSSPKFHTWFCGTKLYQTKLEPFLATRGLPLKDKLCYCSFASTMLLFAAIIAPVPIAKVFIGCVFLFLIYYFTFRIKTLK